MSIHQFTYVVTINIEGDISDEDAQNGASSLMDSLSETAFQDSQATGLTITVDVE
jgi:hypothetical protein